MAAKGMAQSSGNGAHKALTSGRVAVAPNDAIWLQDTPTNLMVINGVLITDRLDLDAPSGSVIDLTGPAAPSDGSARPEAPLLSVDQPPVA